eukprot:scaffold133207_cov66-Phaeocystis_antarctica.AAC.8
MDGGASQTSASIAGLVSAGHCLPGCRCLELATTTRSDGDLDESAVLARASVGALCWFYDILRPPGV